jgi:hypothetical protein
VLRGISETLIDYYLPNLSEEGSSYRVAALLRPATHSTKGFQPEPAILDESAINVSIALKVFDIQRIIDAIA